VPNRRESVTLNDPVLVDHILRPAHASKAVSIGRYLQGPRKLEESTLTVYVSREVVSSVVAIGCAFSSDTGGRLPCGG
jgi:hypothetical protein